jgi:hypothetical protein
MASVYWTDRAEDSLLEIGRYIIELVIYRPQEDGIAIILVTHGHRDLRTVVEQIFGPGSLDN